MADKALKTEEIAARIADILRPEIMGVIDIGAGYSVDASCCEGKCPCNERCGVGCTCNTKCGCEGKTASRPCAAENVLAGLPIESITAKDWTRIYENLRELENIRSSVLNKK